jgi:hypothetical protein
MDGSTVVSINSGTEMVQVDWDDGGTRNREVPSPRVAQLLGGSPHPGICVVSNHVADIVDWIVAPVLMV